MILLPCRKRFVPAALDTSGFRLRPGWFDLESDSRSFSTIDDQNLIIQSLKPLAHKSTICHLICPINEFPF